MNRPVVAYKRAFVTLTDGQVGVAGAFALAPVPLDATAPPDSWFSAFLLRMDAVRYQPCTAALLTVNVTDPRTEGRGPGIVTGTGQTAVRAELHPLCTEIGCIEPAAVFQWIPLDATRQRVPLGSDTLTVLTGRCPRHRRPDLTVDLSTLPLPVALGSVELAGYQRRRLDRPQPRPRWCGCAEQPTLDAAHGLHLYIRELWDWASARQQPDGTMHVTCRRCGTRWKYRRIEWPVTATVLPDQSA